MREIRLDLAEVKQSPPEPVREAVRDAATEINRYPSGDYRELKQEFAEYIGVEESQVCFSNGLDEMIDILTGIWGGRSFVPVPTFSQFAEASRRRGQEAVEVSMMEKGEYSIDMEKVDFGLDLIWLCSPNNPTGTEIPREKIERICGKASGKVVVDECYAEFTGNSCVDLIKKFDNLVVLRSFSKSFGLAGLRLGAAVSSGKNIERIEEYRQPFNVSRVAAEAGKAALRNQERYEDIREEILDGGEGFAEFLEDRGLETGEVNGNFLLVEFEDREEAKRYYQGLEKLDVSVFPGWDEEFSGLDGRYLRFTIGTAEQMGEVENRFKILEQKLSQED
jgi:histidinol-phosphate aminotransferase